MTAAKIFLDGHSQAVRLSKAFRLEGMTEVFIQRDGDRVILSPGRRRSWRHCARTLRPSAAFLASVWPSCRLVWPKVGARNLQAVAQFLEPLEIADVDRAATQVCGPLRARLETVGAPIGLLDTQIAGHALALGVTLLSSKTCEFARNPGLLPDNLVAAG